MATIKAVCFGEVLWDVFPGEERIGGAPLNVASRLSSLGVESEMISHVGKDKRGEEIIFYLRSKGVRTENIGVDEKHATGVVNVTLSAGGSASYDIAHPAAWDKIKVTGSIKKAVKDSSCFVFGSLVCRDQVSRDTLYELLPMAKYKVFDCNLRPPHYEERVLKELMGAADLVKFNDDELFEIAGMLGSPYNSLEQNIWFIKDKFPVQSICVTKGSHGAVLLHQGQLFYNSGYKIKVKDTVGAGDSFLATLLAGLLRDKGIQHSLDMACAMGALVAASEGANPSFTTDKVSEFMNPV